MQRLFDIALAAVAVIVLFPFMLPVVAILKITGEGDVFYSQIRVGKNGRKFGLLKFATMLRNSPTIGAGEITLKNDPRILPFGKFLRKTKLNELPQLLNILAGDMSVVGPRPMVPSTWDLYPVEAQRKIGSCRPGLTGVGSIIFRDEERFLQNLEDPRRFYDGIILPYKILLEEWYIENRSLFLYFKVIVITAFAVLFPNSTLPEKSFNGIPDKPKELKVNHPSGL